MWHSMGEQKHTEFQIKFFGVGSRCITVPDTTWPIGITEERSSCGKRWSKASLICCSSLSRAAKVSAENSSKLSSGHGTKNDQPKQRNGG